MEPVFSASNVSDIVLWAMVLGCSILGMMAMASPQLAAMLRDIILDKEDVTEFDDWRDLNDEQVKRIRKVKHTLDEYSDLWETFPNGTIYVTAAGDIFFYPDGTISPDTVSHKISDVPLNDIVEFLVFEMSDGNVMLPSWMD